MAEAAESGGNAPDAARRLYRTALLIRRVEEILLARYHEANEMRCPMHFCIGQEAAPAALAELLRPEDAVYTHYRSHGYYLAKGAPLAAMIAEFHGKASGANGGMGGSMELAHHDSLFYSGAIVGGPVGLALGHAFAQAYRKEPALTVSVVGDGAFDEGIGFEVLSFAALHRLPLLVLCENNGYAAHTGLADRGAPDLISTRARAFGVPVHVMDGNDPLQLLARLGPLCDGIRGGGGPVFCEVLTYRTCSHVGPESDDALGYRPPEEVAKWRLRDPLLMLESVLQDQGATAAELAALRDELDAGIQAAYAAAQAAPAPAPADLDRFVQPAGDAQVAIPFTEVVETAFRGGQAEARLEPY
ncbi:thiamine pyrophosphate-dependent dehydrogenase E1 component subunit alpha [Marinibaculum pumilum]|uniref:Thiamine pyrophosphate-dependent dehydrogenase E1 component subunit alpha n=1 Tax=Marinibaculum pumilum TaxID=1766165 RepID=A0ABV7KXZ0_9PROT